MSYILDKVGDLDTCDKAFITKRGAVQYIEKMSHIKMLKSGKKAVSLRKRFSGIKNEALVDLLVGML